MSLLAVATLILIADPSLSIFHGVVLVLGARLLHAIVFQASWSRELFCHLRQQGIDGRVLKVDGSHKYVKLVRVFESDGTGGTKPVHCMMTSFNEFEQVRE